ncbi:MAG: hypothetical protein ACTSR8_10495 [Promethearchaeota archaeon]
MQEEKKFFIVLSLIILVDCILLLVKFSLVWFLLKANLWDYLGLIWPAIGIATIFEYLRPQRDKWGWGGLLFHFFILYCGFYYIIEFILLIISFTYEQVIIINAIIYLAISTIAWIGFLYYYD